MKLGRWSDTAATLHINFMRLEASYEGVKLIAYLSLMLVGFGI
jgi:hypothetical protein